MESFDDALGFFEATTTLLRAAKYRVMCAAAAASLGQIDQDGGDGGADLETGDELEQEIAD